MTRHRIALVVNPASGLGRATRVAPAVTARLRTRADVDVVAGTSAAESQHLLAALPAARHDAVVLLGGDGIVHLAVQVLAGGDVPVTVIPAGTGNDVADALGMPRDPLAAADAVLDALDAGSVHRIDLGRTSGGRWWITVLCAGFDSAVNDRANRMRWPRGRWAVRRYDLAIAAEFVRLHARPFQIELDGERLDTPAVLVAVGNGEQYGGGKRITHGARIDDGRFLVTVVAPVSRLDFARLAPTLPRAGHLTHPAVSTHAARRVRLAAPATVAFADGERVAALPVETECVPGALPVLRPHLDRTLELRHHRPEDP